MKKSTIFFLLTCFVIFVIISLFFDNSRENGILKRNEKFKKRFDSFDWTTNSTNRIEILDFFEFYIKHSIKSMVASGVMGNRLLNSKDMERIYEDMINMIKEVKVTVFNNHSLDPRDIKKIMSYISGHTRDNLKYYLAKDPNNETLGRINKTWVEIVEPTLQFTYEELDNRRLLILKKHNLIRVKNTKPKVRKKEPEKFEEISVLEKYPIPEEKKYIKKKIQTPVDINNIKSFFDHKLNIKLFDGRSFDGRFIKIEDDIIFFDIVFPNGTISMKFKKSEIMELNETTEILVVDE